MEIKIQDHRLVSERINGNEEEFQILVPKARYEVLLMQVIPKLEKQVNVPTNIQKFYKNVRGVIALGGYHFMRDLNV